MWEVIKMGQSVKWYVNTVLLILLVLLLVILGTTRVEAAAKPEAKPFAKSEAKPEGTLTAALPTLAEEGFLPDRCSATSAPLWEPVYDFLIYSDSKTQKPIPGIAERWEYSKDYKTLTFHLRKGVQFHDGWGEVTAEDVKFSIELNTRPTSKNIVGSEIKKIIKTIETPDRYTVVLRLNEPDPVLWLSFCTADNISIPVLCKKYIESVGEDKANEKPVGSGPYKLVEQKAGDYVKFEALDKHWLLVPEFKYLVLRIVPEDSTRIAMLKTGQIDIAHNITMDAVPEIEKAGNRVVVARNAEIVFLPFGGMLLPEDKRYVEGYSRKDPWKDIRVREAMNIAIDRKSIVKTVYGDTATVAPIWIPLSGWQKLPPIPYDPNRAKKLLVEAGFPKGFSFKIVTHNKRPELSLLAEAVAGYWKAIGLNAEIVPGDYTKWRDTNKTGKTAGYLWTHVLGDFPDWSQRLSGYDSPDASTPLWSSEETTAGIKKVQAQLDPAKREAALKELANTYRTLYAHVPLAYVPMLHGVGKRVGEWNPGHTLHPKNFIFARHAKPLNTFRLFTP